MKEYCVDLEIAKELEKNGFPQNTSYFFANFGEGYYFGNGFVTTTNKVCSPISEEILKELPLDINGAWLKIWRTSDTGDYDVSYVDYDKADDEVKIFDIFCYHKKLHIALAKMWLYLKKEGYIK